MVSSTAGNARAGNYPGIDPAGSTGAYGGDADGAAGRSDASTRPVPPCVGGSIGAYFNYDDAFWFSLLK